MGGQEGEHEVELLLIRKTMKRGVTRYLVQWRGHTSADDAWLQLEVLGHCLEQVAKYDAAAPRRRGARRGDLGAGAAAAIPVGVGLHSLHLLPRWLLTVSGWRRRPRF